MRNLFLSNPIRFFCLLAVFSANLAGLWPGHAGVQAQEDSGGVGIILDYDPPGSGNIVVYSVSYKSPADKAHVKRGSQLVKVDGNEVTGKALGEVANLIRGPIGSTVTLTLSHPASGTQEVALIRKSVSKGPTVALPPPSQLGQDDSQKASYLTASEKALVKQKILGLKTEVQQQKMLELLEQFKARKISKQQFLQTINTEFP